MRTRAPVERHPATAAPPPAGETGAASHAHVVLEAEVRRLIRELRSIGPMSSRTLAHRCGASRWHEGRFETAVRRGVRDGRLRRLPFGFLAAVPPAPDDGRAATHGG